MGNISINWELVRSANYQPQPWPTESEALGVGPSSLWLMESSGLIQMHPEVLELTTWFKLVNTHPRGFACLSGGYLSMRV